MKATKSGKKDAGIRLSDETRSLLRDRAKARQMTQPEYVAFAIRQEAQAEVSLKQQLAADAKAQAMFAERNEYDR